MRQTLLISIFVNLSVSFQPSDNLYTTLSRICLLQIITGAYPSDQVNRGWWMREILVSAGDAGLQRSTDSLIHRPFDDSAPATIFPVGRSPPVDFPK